jgi:hypothetical protein
LLAIPAGFEPATHGVEIRYSTECGVGRIASWMFHNLRSAHFGKARANLGLIIPGPGNAPDRWLCRAPREPLSHLWKCASRLLRAFAAWRLSTISFSVFALNFSSSFMSAITALTRTRHLLRNSRLRGIALRFGKLPIVFARRFSVISRRATLSSCWLVWKPFFHWRSRSLSFISVLLAKLERYTLIRRRFLPPVCLNRIIETSMPERI